MIKATKINKSYGTRLVLSEVSFSIGKGQKIALVGHNGTGKTTLLRILSGELEIDGGKLEIPKGICVGYLPQDTKLASKESIIDYLRSTSGIDAIENELALLSKNLQDPKNVQLYSDVQETYEKLDGYSFTHKVEVMLEGFGLKGVSLDRSVSSLSSGQRSKVVLIGILLKGVDLLLLDEPTNNLDLPALIWLEDFIGNTSATCVIVSHDRQFLDRIVRKIFEIDWNTHSLNVSNGKYTDYLKNLAKKISRQKLEYRLQQDEIERLTERAREKRVESTRGAKYTGTDNDKFARGFHRDQAARSGKTAKVIEKRIDQMEKVEKPVEREPLSISLEVQKYPGTLSIKLDELVSGYEDGFSIGPVSMTIDYGNRVGIMGLNGSGKSTLLKTITGQLQPLSGRVSIGSGVRIGNMMQEHDTLPSDKTLIEFFREETRLREDESFAKLRKFSFDEQQIRHLVGDLSPGGRSRFLLALFSAKSVNVLVLDEPTNHLDIEALDALEEVIKSYEGTIILVSHDRYFLENAKLDQTYVLSDGKFSKIPDYGTYVASAEERARKLLRLL